MAERWGRCPPRCASAPIDLGSSPIAGPGSRLTGFNHKDEMPISYRIDDGGDVVHVSFRGRVTIEEFRDNRATLMSDPRFRPSMHRLTDVRELTELPSTHELRALALLAGEARQGEPEGVRRGVLVGSRAEYGVIRQYQAFLWNIGASVDVLSSDAEADAWLKALT